MREREREREREVSVCVSENERCLFSRSMLLEHKPKPVHRTRAPPLTGPWLRHQNQTTQSITGMYGAGEALAITPPPSSGCLCTVAGDTPFISATFARCRPLGMSGLQSSSDSRILGASAIVCCVVSAGGPLP